MKLYNSVCLVTNEFYPITHGGCGTLLYNSVFELLGAGVNVILLIDIPLDKVSVINKATKSFPNINNLQVCTVGTLTGAHETDAPVSEGYRQSLRFYKALESLFLKEKAQIDLIEFPDYFGYGYHTIAAKRSGIPWLTAELYIRYHLTIELINNCSSFPRIGKGQLIIQGMERWCLDNADAVIFPSNAVRDEVAEYYKLECNTVISEPSLSALTIKERKAGIKKSIVFYARLAPQKGVEYFVSAARTLLSRGIVAPDTRFLIIGPDIYQSPDGRNMQSYLLDMIPREERNYFQFLGHVSHKKLQKLLPSVKIAVFPSRQESFCYSAREFAMAGVPIVVSDLPAFEDLKEKAKAMTFSFKNMDLADKMQTMLQQPDAELMNNYISSPRNFLYGYMQRNRKIVKLSGSGSQKIVVIILFKGNNNKLKHTVKSINKYNSVRTVIAEKSENGKSVFRGCRWNMENPPTIEDLGFCFLEEGDVLDNGYLEWARSILINYPDMGIVGCRISVHGDHILDDCPWDASPEMMPVFMPGVLRRFFIRCNKKTLELAFSPETGPLNETAAAWKVYSNGLKTLRHPEFQINCESESVYDVKVDMSIKTITLGLLHEYEDDDRLRLSCMLRHLAISGEGCSMNLAQQIRQGYTPEIDGYRINLKNLIKLVMLRIKSRVQMPRLFF